MQNVQPKVCKFETKMQKTVLFNAVSIYIHYRSTRDWYSVTLGVGYIVAGKGRGQLKKKRFLSGIARIMGGGVYSCPNFLALFLEVHFWSIKRVYFFKNANVLNF